MYYIAVFDGDKDSSQNTFLLLNAILHELTFEYTIDTYSCRQDLLELIRKNPAYYDVVFVDIPPEDTSAVELCRDLNALHMTARIVFLSSVTDYVFDGYDVGAINYFVKPIDRAKLKRLLYADYQSNCLSRKILVPIGAGHIQLSPDYIVFLEVINKTVRVRYEKDEEFLKSTLSSIKKYFEPFYFLQCHRSYLINPKFIKQIMRTSLIMTNGDTVPISKYRYKELINQFHDYLEPPNSHDPDE